MGILEDVLRSLADEDPDFYKVRNRPGEGFAVDCHVRLQDVLDMGPDRAAVDVAGVDDYDNPVSEVPLGWTARCVALDFLNCGILLPEGREHMTLGELFYHLASTLSDICTNPCAYELSFEIPKGFFEHLTVERLVWLAAAGTAPWFMIINDEHLEKLDLLPRYIGGDEDA